MDFLDAVKRNVDTTDPGQVRNAGLLRPVHNSQACTALSDRDVNMALKV